MGFWIFMTICNLLIPVIMIVVGNVFVKHPPKTINEIYGYRTSMARKNQDTWDFAQTYCGRLWRIIGWIMLPIAVLPMLPLIGGGDNAVGIVGAVVETIECIVLIVAIIPVEKALKKNFDQDGKRK